jgi:hypothetical protein
MRPGQQSQSWLQKGTSSRKFDASGGDLGLQDGHRLLVEVFRWLRWKPAHPVAIGQGKAEQTKRHDG